MKKLLSVFCGIFLLSVMSNVYCCNTKFLCQLVSDQETTEEESSSLCVPGCARYIACCMINTEKERVKKDFKKDVVPQRKREQRQERKVAVYEIDKAEQKAKQKKR